MLKCLKFVSSFIILFAVFNPSLSHGLTVFTSADDAILCAEAYPNIAFHTFGFSNITNVSRSNTTSNTTDTTVLVSSNFIFTVDGLAYSGLGTWESIETEDSLTITLDHSLENDGNVLNYHYTSISDFNNDTKDETVTASYGASTLSILKHTEETITPTSKSTSINGTVAINGEQFNTSISIVENIVSPETTQFIITTQSTPITPIGPVTELSAECQLVTDINGSIATLSSYDVSIGGTLTYTLDTSATSTHQVEIIDGNSATESLVMNLLHVTNGNKKIKYQIENPVQVTYVSKLRGGRSGSEWNWNDFCEKVSENALLGGAGAALAVLVPTDGGAPISAPTAFAFGYLIGGALGALEYSHAFIWNEIFKGNSPPTAVKTATFAENGTITFGQNSQGGSSYSIPTLSEWKQIFLTLIMLSLVMGFMRKTHPTVASSNGCTMLRITDVNFLAFNRHVYTAVLKWVGVAVVLGIVGVTVVFGHLNMVDIIGTLLCAPLIAYILHLMISFTHDYKGISG
jgi:hypothetical protein